MNEKKIASNFRISVNYFLATGFIVGILLFILGLITLPFLGIEKLQKLDLNPIANVIVFLSILIVFWVGIKHGAEYVNKKFVISDNKKITQFVTIYFAILFILPLINNFDLMGLIRGIGLAIIYYYLSTKYLKKSI